MEAENKGRSSTKNVGPSRGRGYVPEEEIAAGGRLQRASGGRERRLVPPLPILERDRSSRADFEKALHVFTVSNHRRISISALLKGEPVALQSTLASRGGGLHVRKKKTELLRGHKDATSV